MDVGLFFYMEIMQRFKGLMYRTSSYTLQNKRFLGVPLHIVIYRGILI